MRCPFCGQSDTKVIDSRLAEDGDQVRRRRECVSCEERFTTFEKLDAVLPRVVKTTGERELFKESKLLRGMQLALEKRPVDSDQIDASVANILRNARNCGEREIKSRVVGEWVMEELRMLDQVAYVRFASVYKDFEDINAFRDLINRLDLPVAD